MVTLKVLILSLRMDLPIMILLIYNNQLIYEALSVIR